MNKKEKEKEAIEVLKQIQNSLYVEEYHYEWQLAIDIVLNLIDKLQKENKELRNDNKEWQMFIKEHTKTHYVSKDIIRNKIKELEEVKQKEEKENKDEFGINSNTWAIADWGIEVLKELLGE